ncbi:MAG TPA: PKD domain-containing protein [Mycobacteriales bacterium]|nr:PKD domain-containing protein [Mycobacteriales bacterium]
MSLVAVGLGSSWADQVQPDGDSGDHGLGPVVFSSSTQCDGTDTLDGVMTITYQGSSHFGAGDALTVTFSPPSGSGITVTASDNPTVPDPWPNTAGTFTLPIHTKISSTTPDNTYQVGVTVADSGYTTDSLDPSGRPQFGVQVQCGHTSGGSTGQGTNSPPTADAGAPYTGNEGSAISLSGATASDADSDPLTYAWSYADANGVTNAAGSSCSFSDETTLNPTVTCNDNGHWTLTLSVSDGVNTPATTDTADLQVSNVNPTVNSILLSNNSGTACNGGNSVNFGFTFTDPGVIDNPWSPDITWGDGSSNTTTPTVGAQSGSALWTVAAGTYTHTYGAGTFTPATTLTDKDNGTSSSLSATSGSVSFLYSTGSGILQPINADKSSNFKLGSVFPIKIRIADCNNAPVSGISPRVRLDKVTALDSDSVSNETTVSSTPDVGDYMRYDSTAGQWIYNLSSKKTTLVPTGALSLGFYKVTVYDTAGTFTPAAGWFQIVK